VAGDMKKIQPEVEKRKFNLRLKKENST